MIDQENLRGFFYSTSPKSKSPPKYVHLVFAILDKVEAEETAEEKNEATAKATKDAAEATELKNAKSMKAILRRVKASESKMNVEMKAMEGRII